MNSIIAKYDKSEFSNGQHLTIHIDGMSLDIILHKMYPNKNIIGLIPTLLDWLDDENERKLVWERIESCENQIVPILMCPDDVDFWCTIINVEIEKTKNTVKWKRIGLDIRGFHPFALTLKDNYESTTWELEFKVVYKNIEGRYVTILDGKTEEIEIKLFKGKNCKEGASFAEYELIYKKN